MLIKSADDKAASIRRLEAIKIIPGLPASKRTLVEQEIRTTLAGMRGEADTAYEIEFHLSNSKNTMILHDLRFVLDDGRVAQIDHALIHRCGRMWILETKRVSSGIKITEDGEFLRWNGRTYEGMASPLEQNRRHVEVLRDVLRKVKTSFEVGTIHPYVVVSSKARIDRPPKEKFDSSLIVKADQFLSTFERDLQKTSFFEGLSGLFASGGHRELAQELVALHQPIDFDYAARFDVSREDVDRALSQAPATITVASVGLRAESIEVPAAGAPESSCDGLQPCAFVLGNQSEGDHRCRECRSAALAVTYGQYGYYFKCKDCNGNTPIRITCGYDGHDERIRKQGAKFFRDCADCGTSRLFYLNV
ncbi:NERD domain-containing protein (plasmid) [Burkholderia vietnamiensis]|uniref:NERD domain protein n=1 Tax=Burkholderia vietnamiensis (strain G4 / LMG 22486) TaxID=269482 RepID=A4JU16_BURVG|nr:NERD domain protein [Burkholderia vietnamiensis G4]MCB4350073.1 NERD domain-containing protein [Burkholderia vietnamiensis]